MKRYLVFIFLSIVLNSHAGTLKTYLGISSEKYQPKHPTFYCLPVNIVFAEDENKLQSFENTDSLKEVNIKSIDVLKWPNMGHAQQPLLFKTDIIQLITSIQSRKFEKSNINEVSENENQNAKKTKLVFGKFSRLNFHYKFSNEELKLSKIRIQLGSDEFLYDFFLKNICNKI
ncbi:hypothetical protein N9N67_08905 [Bacteriovoracaceae bacterium]|nr:hypothetical protein [Bacteriovoracaceae bacterium]